MTAQFHWRRRHELFGMPPRFAFVVLVFLAGSWAWEGLHGPQPDIGSLVVAAGCGLAALMEFRLWLRQGQDP